MAAIELERTRGVTTVTLNRPERKNAMDGGMWHDLHDALGDIDARDEDRVVVLRGAGGDFCSGADLSAPREQGSRLTDMRFIGEVALRLHGLAKPTIASVDGVAVGAGCNLALGCDLVVASDRARFSEIFARRGLSVDFAGSWLLPRLVGLHKAKELVLLAEILPASEAARIGLVNLVVPSSELDQVVSGWASRLAEGPPIALSTSKRMLDSSFEMSFAEAVEAEALAQAVNFATEDAREALAAFKEKRPAVFRGA